MPAPRKRGREREYHGTSCRLLQKTATFFYCSKIATKRNNNLLFLHPSSYHPDHFLDLLLISVKNLLCFLHQRSGFAVLLNLQSYLAVPPKQKKQKVNLAILDLYNITDYVEESAGDILMFIFVSFSE